MPTLTEVADIAKAPTALHQPAADERTARWVDEVMGRLTPQVDTLLSNRLRDVLAPAVQDAFLDAVERFRGPLTEAVAHMLRDVLEQEMARKAAEVPEAPENGYPRS
ncbi:MAG: hypothetical protein WCI59_07175 [Betaproteobacteria bacterium]